MRKISIFVLAILISMGITLVPANAILGLSACEKTTKAIIAEEKIGLILHKKYAAQRKIILAMSNPTWNDLNATISWLPDVYDSDLRIFNFVDKNSSCFTSQQVARARAETRGLKKNITDISNIRNYLIKNSNVGTKFMKMEQVQFVKNLYPDYYSFLSDRKLK